MANIFHVLNGDALKNQFPEDITGEIIVVRECLVDGNIDGENLENLYANRIKFLFSAFTVKNKREYYKKTIREFNKIQNINDEAEINFWFEDDLFCQVNLWFVFHLLKNIHVNSRLFLVRPVKGKEYSFGAMNKNELKKAFRNRKTVKATDLLHLKLLWKYFQNNHIFELENTARLLQPSFPFLLPAVLAHNERIPDQNNPGRPVNSMIKIMKELNTIDYKPVFKEFCKREAIYGFGDLQVKRIYDKIIQQHNAISSDSVK